MPSQQGRNLQKETPPARPSAGAATSTLGRSAGKDAGRQAVSQETPGSPPSSTSEESAVQRTIAAFQPFYTEPLTKEMASEIRRNLLGAVEMLLKWEREALDRDRGSADEPMTGPRADEAGRTE